MTASSGFAAQGDTIFSRLSALSGSDSWKGVASYGQSVYVGGGRTNTSGGLPVPVLRRYSRSGELMWTRSVVTGGWSHGEVNAVAADDSGIYVTGTFLDHGDDQAFMARYRPNATLVWIRQLDVGVRDWTSAITTFGSSIYVTGNFASQEGGEYPFLRRYMRNGKIDWTRTVGFNDDSGNYVLDATWVAANAQGVYVVGRAVVDQGATAVVFVRHYDEQGNLPWTDTRPIAGLDYATGVAADDTGAYVTASANTYDPNTDEVTP